MRIMTKTSEVMKSACVCAQWGSGQHSPLSELTIWCLSSEACLWPDTALLHTRTQTQILASSFSPNCCHCITKHRYI